MAGLDQEKKDQEYPAYPCLVAEGKGAGCQGCVIKEEGYCEQHREIISQRFNKLKSAHGGPEIILQTWHEVVMLRLWISTDFRKGVEKIFLYWLISVDQGRSGPRHRWQTCPGIPDNCLAKKNNSCHVHRDNHCEWLCQQQEYFMKLYEEKEIDITREKAEEMYHKLLGKICTWYNKDKRDGIRKYTLWATTILTNVRNGIYKNKHRTSSNISEWISRPPEGLDKFCASNPDLIFWDKKNNMLRALNRLTSKFQTELENLASKEEWRNKVRTLAKQSRKPIFKQTLPTESDDNDNKENDDIDLLSKPDLNDRYKEAEEMDNKMHMDKCLDLLRELLLNSDSKLALCARIFLMLYENYGNRSIEAGKEERLAAEHLGFTYDNFRKNKSRCRPKMIRVFAERGLA